MPSKKNKGRAKASAAPAHEPEQPSHTSHASSSSSSSALRPTPVTTSASSAAAANLKEALTKPRVHDLSQMLGGCGGAQPSTAPIASSAAVSSDAATFVSDENDGDNFEDTLEELTADCGEFLNLPETPEDPLAVLLSKNPELQVPAPSRADWESEMHALPKLVMDDATPAEQKVQILHEALTQRVEDLRSFEEHRTHADRCMEDLTKDRDRCRKETQAALAAKCKLEDSCRELQQLKISITQENKKIVEDEQARQGELNDKFQAAMKDVEEKMHAESEIREHFIKENDELRTKLDKFTETYEEQEGQLAEQCAVRGKEMQAATERLQEYETKSAESKVNAGQLEKKNKTLQKTTAALRAELQSILGKFDEFHESVNGSSAKHGECKSEIDGLSAKLKELEDENTELKSNSKSNEIAKAKEAAQKQCDALEKLCNNLQKEIVSIRERNGATGKKGGS